MVKEQIKWIEGYEGLYLITSYGRVFSVVRRDKFSRINSGGEIKQSSTATGYKFVCLYKDGHSEKIYVHRLVAMAFIPNKRNKPAVDHIDNNKDNNNVENLRWVSHIENMNNKITRSIMLSEPQKYISQKGSDNPFSRRVAVYTVDGTHVGNFDSGGLALEKLGLPKTLNIARVARGERAQSHGYVFKYLSEARMKMPTKEDYSYTMKPILQLDLDGNIIAEYESIREAAKKLGVHSSNIGKAARGQFKTCAGYKWRYK